MPLIQGETLRRWRESRKWDVPELARQIRQEAGGDPSLPAHDSLTRMIRRWEKVGLNPSSRAQRYALLYAAVFSVSPGDLAVGPAEPGVVSLLPAWISEESDESMKRREFGLVALGVLAGAAVPSNRVPSSVSMTHVSELRQLAAQLCDSESQIGGSTLLQRTTALYSCARAMLDNGSYASAVGAKLQSTSAELAGRAGFMAFDSAQQGLARTLLTESVMLTTGHDPLVAADSYSLLALQSAHLAALAGDGRTGLARESLRFLDLADGAARHEASPKVHATIAMRRARAYGLLSDTREVRANITIARRELDRGDHPADPYWTAFVTPAEVTGHEAMASLGLGQPDTAATLFRDVLDDRALPGRNRALYQAGMASALAAAGDRSQAMTEGMQVLPALEGAVKSPRTLNGLRPVRQLAPCDSEFAIRFDALAAAS